MSDIKISMTSLSAQWVQKPSTEQNDNNRLKMKVTHHAPVSSEQSSKDDIESASEKVNSKPDNQTASAEDGASQNLLKDINLSGQSLPSIQPTSAESSKSNAAVPEGALDNAVEVINDYVQSIQRDIKFSIDDTTGKTIIQVVNSSTNEVVRQLPSDVALQLAQNLQKNGSLVSFKV